MTLGPASFSAALWTAALGPALRATLSPAPHPCPLPAGGEGLVEGLLGGWKEEFQAWIPRIQNRLVPSRC